MFEAKYFFKIKNASQKILHFFVREVFNKSVIQYAFDDNLSVTHIFIKGILTRDFRPLVFFIKQLPLGP
jgi:hypothetical protein